MSLTSGQAEGERERDTQKKRDRGREREREELSFAISSNIFYVEKDILKGFIYNVNISSKFLSYPTINQVC